MPLPRFRIRTLMIVVAALALMLGVALWVRRENERQALAERQALFEAIARANQHQWKNFPWDTLLSREPSGGDQPPGVPPDQPEPLDSLEPM